MKKRKHYHTLYIDDSEASKEAKRLVEKCRIDVAVVPVSPGPREFSVLPYLISSAGDFRGLAAVKRFVVSPLSKRQ